MLMLSVIMLNVFMLGVTIKSTMLSVIMLKVIMPNVVAPISFLRPHFIIGRVEFCAHKLPYLLQQPLTNLSLLYKRVS